MALLRYDASDDAPDYYERRQCKCCQDKDEKHENAKEFFEGVVKQLYSKQDLDISILEHCLDELSYYFDFRINQGDLMVERFVEVKHV